MSSRKVNTPRKPNCKVCQDAGKPETEWAHWPKDKTGKTTCPTLLALDCRYCQKAGHTVKYCPKLAKDNSDKERREKQPEKKQEKKHEPVNRFALLLDDDDSDNELATPTPCKRTIVKEVMKEDMKEDMKKDQEYPQLCAPSKVKYTSNKATFSEMVNKPIEVYEEEKRTQDEEHLIQAIKSGMVVLKQKPYTEAVKPAPQPKPIKRYAKWTDADDDSSSDEEDNDKVVSTDAW
jgi:hypothetical protein